MAKRTWTVRTSVPEDLDGIRDLFGTVWGHSPTLSHVLWKFRDNPAGLSIGVVAVDDAGRIVGQHILIPTWLRLGNEVVLGAQSVDAMTHPDYRGQGMFVELAKACVELGAAKGLEALYGFPNARIYPPMTRRVNWDHTGDIPRWVRPLNAARTSLPSVVKPVAAVGVHLLRRGRRGAGDIEIRIGRPSDHDLESLLATWKASEELCRVERSMEWISWRFDAKSQRAYEWMTAYRGGTARAYAIWGILRPEAGGLADLIGSDSEALEAATSAAVQRAKERGMGTLSAVTNEQDAIRALKSCGFFRRGSYPLIVRSMTARNLGGNIHDHASWRIISADLDTY